MAISEETRHRLHVRLDEVLGPEEASTLMEHLPTVGWADVATKRDLDNGLGRLGADFRTEMVTLRTDLKDEIGNLGTELRGELTKLSTEFERELKIMSFQFFALVAAVAVLAITVIKVT